MRTTQVIATMAIALGTVLCIDSVLAPLGIDGNGRRKQESAGRRRQ